MRWKILTIGGALGTCALLATGAGVSSAAAPDRPAPRAATRQTVIKPIGILCAAGTKRVPAVIASFNGSLTLTHPARGEGDSYSRSLWGLACGLESSSGAVREDSIVFGPATLHMLGSFRGTLRVHRAGPVALRLTKSSKGTEVDLRVTVSNRITFNQGDGSQIVCGEGPITIDYSSTNPGGKALTGSVKSGAKAVVTAYHFTMPKLRNIKGCSTRPTQGFGYLADLGANLPNDHTGSKLTLNLSLLNKRTSLPQH